MTKTQFTILIPYFDKPESLPKILTFLEAHPQWVKEIIVLCDGSKPPPSVINRCKLIEIEENHGLSWGRNELLQRCCSENVLFLDADAVPINPFFEVLNEQWDRQSFFAGREFSSPQEGYANLYRSLYLVQTHGDKDLHEAPFFMGLCFGGKLENFNILGGFHEGFRNHGEDLEFSFRALAKNYRIQYLSGLRVFHERFDDSESLRNMIRNHAKFQVFAHLCHGISIINVIWQATLWIPVSAWSSLKRVRSLRFTLFCLLHSAYSLLYKLTAPIHFKKESYESIQPGHIFRS